ncbi:hypothetical protein KMZ93_11345 [Bradyrhizobium sediminis]|uniref:Uncharacterized protein n=1 Tax=Bradyrhizobium sediminis TaxID=2840469 RepID=A0A975P2H4_9BRAD|nr:hypothetical protein [Bradyrhizobium sediminis]QWG25420.1 hypothetical protein KMZ93_11345 [Bradyrhizobium sediminis]
MSGIRDTALQIAAVTAVVAALGVVPASAIEVAAGSDEPVSRAVAVAANEIRDAIPAHGSAATPMPQRRPKMARVLRAPPTRPVAHRDWTCSGGWCGRQFVLMIGIGF